MFNRYRCRAYSKDSLTHYYQCVVMFDTSEQAIDYVENLKAKMQTPAHRVEAEWLGVMPQKLN